MGALGDGIRKPVDTRQKKKEDGAFGPAPGSVDTKLSALRCSEHTQPVHDGAQGGASLSSTGRLTPVPASGNGTATGHPYKIWALVASSSRTDPGRWVVWGGGSLWCGGVSRSNAKRIYDAQITQCAALLRGPPRPSVSLRHSKLWQGASVCFLTVAASVSLSLDVVCLLLQFRPTRCSTSCSCHPCGT